MAHVTGKFKVNRVIRDNPSSRLLALSWATKHRQKDGSEEFAWSSMIGIFVGDAFAMAQGLQVDDWIILEGTNGQFTNEPYEPPQGEKKWDNPQVLVFDFGFPESRDGDGGGGRRQSKSLLGGNTGSNVEEPDEDEFPF